MIAYKSIAGSSAHLRPIHGIFQKLVCRRIAASANALTPHLKSQGDSAATKVTASKASHFTVNNVTASDITATDAPGSAQDPPADDVFDKHSPNYWRKDKTLPEYKRHKLAMKEKLNGKSWQPHKRVSREVMDHMKQLAREDPTKWTAETLATMYKKSPEAVRRILKSKYEPKMRPSALESEEWSKIKDEAAERMHTVSSEVPGYKRTSRAGSGRPWKQESQASGYRVERSHSRKQ